MKLHWLVALVALSSLVNAQDEFKEKSSFRIYSNAAVNFNANQEPTSYEGAFIIPFRLEETDPSFYSSYTRSSTKPSWSYSVDISYQMAVKGRMFVELGAGYNQVLFINHVTGPTDFDLSHPSLRVEDELATYSIGPTLGFDLLPGWRKNFEIYAGLRYYMGIRELDAELQTLDGNDPTEEWQLLSRGVQYNIGFRWAQTSSSGIGYSIGFNYVGATNYSFHEASRTELYLGDYTLEDGTELRWNYELLNGNVKAGMMNDVFNLSRIDFQFGLHFAF